eukprot:CAMPEP_0173426500 /NCGR_PEP_ID=MMETSP1357-20121228/5941_1 /TAXON_ID=77926 /ORGANISM="Hemiselmis rufescens, Strain PCC563" /LENGTH=67 /DNA_ID=CAMNT_0014390173 /DNA_START=45 /DNA_END=248 /DNA_ORIENTATION=-
MFATIQQYSELREQLTTSLFLPDAETMGATNAKGLFSNFPIDSNDIPPGNNQQVCAEYHYPEGCVSA